MNVQLADPELKTRHRAMWASGDYPLMVETFLLPVGSRLAAACDLGRGAARARRRGGHRQRVDPGRALGRDRHGQRPDAGAARRRPARARRPRGSSSTGSRRTPSACRSRTSPSTSSCPPIGVMFAPHHQDAADELVRVCRPGGTIGLLSWTPDGMLGALFRDDEAVRPAAPARRAAAAAVGQRAAPARALRRSGAFHTLERDVLEITAFERPRDYGEHFTAYYGPAIAARANAARNGRDARVRRGAGAVLRRVEPRHPRAGALRDGVPARGRHAAVAQRAGSDGSRPRGRLPFGADAERASSDAGRTLVQPGRARNSGPFSLPSPPQVRRVREPMR